MELHFDVHTFSVLFIQGHADLIIHDKKNFLIFFISGYETSVFMSLLLDTSYLKRISM